MDEETCPQLLAYVVERVGQCHGGFRHVLFQLCSIECICEPTSLSCNGFESVCVTCAWRATEHDHRIRVQISLSAPDISFHQLRNCCSVSSRGKYMSYLSEKFYDSGIENIETFGNNDCQIMEFC